MYDDEDLIMISGIQHYYYCKRQWGLIHIEQLWEDNIHTVKGEILHDNVDNPNSLSESRNDIIIERSTPIVSYSLGYFGIADVVEFKKDSSGVLIKKRGDYFKVTPVEYKVGKPKNDECDAVQLCVQAICLEEMLETRINEGFLYYGKTRHRQRIEIDERIRNTVYELSKEMHLYLENDFKIKPIFTEKCEHCSLKNICLPKISSKYSSVKSYIHKMICEEGEDH